MEKWILKNKQGDIKQYMKELGCSDLLAKVMINRGFDLKQASVFLNVEGSMHDPKLLFDSEKACDILRGEIKKGNRIRVIGDYDCDGICATYILWKTLHTLGAKVDYCLPHRMKDGYGLSNGMVLDAIEQGIQTIITCDNGIAALEQIALAKQHGLTVIVTDHHEVPFLIENGIKKELLPMADAIVNIKCSQDHYPFKGICGAVIAWKISQILLGEAHEVVSQLMSYAAIATVCDVMELIDENRQIVAKGLEKMTVNPPVGIEALKRVYEIETVTSYHLGFVIGPCLNATGRLESAELALSLLCEENLEKAVILASTLKELNETRKEMTLQGVEEALELLEQSKRKKDKVIVLYLPNCHESLAGIIAGKIREACHRPTLVFTDCEDGVKASGRSMECYDMFESLSLCKQLFTKFGGHKMAAGLSMSDASKIEILRKLLNEQCTLEEEDFREKVYIDAAVYMSYATIAMAKELESLEPHGVGNKKPLFAEKDMEVIHARALGKKGKAAKLMMRSSKGELLELTYLGDVTPFHSFLDKRYGVGASKNIYEKQCAYKLHILYQIQVNYYKGNEYLQLLMKYYC
ncbi:MAG: single-stranded-DNA-specific exonuclease RecJ [Lachnospiraceae bacterium]